MTVHIQIPKQCKEMGVTTMPILEVEKLRPREIRGWMSRVVGQNLAYASKRNTAGLTESPFIARTILQGNCLHSLSG